MENNKTNSAMQDESLRSQDPNQKERARKGDVIQANDPRAFDDDYEAGQEDEIIREEGRSEKDNLPGKS